MSDERSAPSAEGSSTTRGRTGRRSTPNFAARRMLVGTGVITIVFVGALLAWQAFRDDPSGPSSEPQTWSEVVFVDRATGDATWVDADGEVVAQSADNGRAGSVFAYDGVVSIANSGTLTVLDPGGGTDAGDDDDDGNLTVEIPSGGRVSTLPTLARTFLVVSSPNGGNVVIVDPVDRIVTDIAEAATETLPATPLMFAETLRANLDGSLFAVADATNFQTIAIRADGEPPVFLPDQPVAVDTELVATGQTVGLQADISLVSLDRTTKADDVPTEIPAGGTMSDERLTMVSIDGGVFRIEPGDEEAERIGTLATPAGETVRSVSPTAHGERLVASGTTLLAIVDLDGDSIYSTVLPTSVDFLRPEPTWACLAVGGPGGWATLVDLASGDVLADLSGAEILGAAGDGCTVLARRESTVVIISADEEVAVGDVDSAILAPDGRSVITVMGDDVELYPIDDSTLGDPIDLGDIAPSGALIAFVPD